MLVGETYAMDCPIVEVFLLLVTIPLVGNVGHTGGFPKRYKVQTLLELKVTPQP